jgi:hypothetical protein
MVSARKMPESSKVCVHITHEIDNEQEELIQNLRVPGYNIILYLRENECNEKIITRLVSGSEGKSS